MTVRKWYRVYMKVVNMTQDLDGQGYLHAAFVVETEGDGKLKILPWLVFA